MVAGALAATLWEALGRKEKAFSLMEATYEERSSTLPYIKVLPIFSEVRADPRFSALLKKTSS